MTTQNSAIVDKLLTDVSNKIMPDDYISEMILPLINVKQTTGKLGNYGNSHLRIENTVTGGKNKFAQVNTRVYETQLYDIEEHGLKDTLTRKDFANVEQPFDAEVDTTDELVTKLWLGKEKSLADTITDTSILTQNTTLAGTDQYNDRQNSDPIGDFITARANIFSSVGKPPDTAVMSWEVFNTIRYHPNFLDSLGYKEARPDGLTTQEVARVMDVKRLLVGTAVFNDAKENQPDNILPVWGKHIIFMVSPRTAAKRQISLGYRLQIFGTPRKVFKNSQIEPPESILIQVSDAYEQLISKASAGYLIEDAIA